MRRNRMFAKVAYITLCTLALSSFCISCTEGYDEDPEFSPGVSNTQLLSPPSDSIKCTLSATGEEVTVSWPVVMGAGGYQLSAYNTDDPSNPVAIVQDKFIDACSYTMPVAEDTHYQFVIKTLGNDQYRNTEASEGSSKDFSTLTPTYMTIPSGTDLTQFFTDNPVVQADSTLDDNGNVQELAYEMELGGSYTISGPIDLSARKVTLRGWKAGHAKLTYGPDGRIWTQNGLKLKFIDFDGSQLSAKDKKACLFGLSENADDNITDHTNYKNFFIKDPIVMQSCNISNLAASIFYDNGKDYLINNFVIKDVFAQLDQQQIPFNFNKTSWLNFKMTESTFYSTTQNAITFLFEGGERPSKLGSGSNKISAWNTDIEQCTFYNLSYGQKRFIQWSRYLGQAAHTWTMKRNIFVDCARNGKATDGTDNGNITKIFEFNTYFYNGAVAETPYDDTTTLQSDPGFKDPAHGDFTVSGSDQLAARTGDPRWLPAATTPENPGEPADSIK